MLYKARVLNDGKIIDKEFKVYIPQVTPLLKEDTNITSVTLKSDRMLSGTVLEPSTFSSRSYIVAKNLSDYPTSMKGVNVFEMERADGVTTMETTNASEASNAAASWDTADTFSPVPMLCLFNGSPHTNHVHRILQGMKFYAMRLTNMNNIDIKVGNECFVWLNGNEAYIVRFIGVQPQSKDDYDYVK